VSDNNVGQSVVGKKGRLALHQEMFRCTQKRHIKQLTTEFQINKTRHAANTLTSWFVSNRKLKSPNIKKGTLSYESVSNLAKLQQELSAIMIVIY